MRNWKRIITSLLISIIIFNLFIPVQTDAAAAKYGIILGTRDYSFQLYDNLVVLSPTGNLMIKAYLVCKKLGLSYSYDSSTGKLTIKNPDNGKSLVYTMGRKNYTFYPDGNAEGSVKAAQYKLYYDSSSKYNVINMQTLRYILNYNYYKDLTDTYYAEMGYNSLIVYSIGDYSSYDIPVTDQVINYINAKTFTTKEKLLDAVRMNLIARRTGITFRTSRRVMDAVGSKNSVYNAVLTIDSPSTSKDGDYLSLLIDQFGQSWRSSSTVIISSDGSRKEVKADTDPASLKIDVKYETLLAQERVVDSKIADILKKLKLDGTSDFEKVRRIHDYIINNANYDTSLMKSSAYDLLVDKTAVCEGYTLTAYRLFTDAGLESRIISGSGNGEPHAWNIVKVDGKWYNIDLTWDDPITKNGGPVLRYDYFLKNSNDFLYHIRNAEFTTTEFLKAYPIAEVSYPIQP